MILGKNFDYLFLEILLQLDEFTFYYYFPQLIAKLLQLYFKYRKFCNNLAILGNNVPTLITKIFNYYLFYC